MVKYSQKRRYFILDFMGILIHSIQNLKRKKLSKKKRGAEVFSIKEKRRKQRRGMREKKGEAFTIFIPKPLSSLSYST